MTYLIADIGATHARFSLLSGSGSGTAGTPVGELDPGAIVVVPTARCPSAEVLVQDALVELGLPSIGEFDGELDGACFAIAGPIKGGSVRITNGGLQFSESQLEPALACPIRLVNDFQALARALPHLQQLDCVGGDNHLGETRAVKALLGPGSGLGMAVLVPQSSRGWRVLASEGGHADLAPGNLLEQEVLALLLAELGSASWETVLSGPGLVRLYHAVAGLWGMTPRDLSAEHISRLGVDAEDPVCHQTLEMFFGFLGSAAGNLALTVCARAGVYIGGGIVPRLADFAHTSPLRRRFEERAGLADFVADIPLYLILDTNPGLLGARVCLMDPD
jgi:glucokinase